MTFAEYQSFCRTTAVYPKETAIDYLILGLCSEAGELAGKRKKQLRGDGYVRPEDILYEVGDVLWYAAEICSFYGYSLEDVAEWNKIKLSARKDAGTIKGSGDNR
jgi:NTP pyrophosphatase (non-canonical NTP hydrolase)